MARRAAHASRTAPKLLFVAQPFKLRTQCRILAFLRGLHAFLLPNADRYFIVAWNRRARFIEDAQLPSLVAQRRCQGCSASATPP